MTEEKNNLTKREIIAISVLLLIIKIVKPCSYSSEYSDELTEVKKSLGMDCAKK